MPHCLIFLSWFVGGAFSSTEIRNIGFGESENSQSVQFSHGNGNRNPLLTILLANTPQLGLSVIYFFYNNLLTRMLLAAEYSRYAATWKPLRLTWPKGSQRSTYYLTIPYKYSVPLLVLSAVVVSICGIFVIPVLMVTMITFLMPCAALALGLRRFETLMPLAGHCSVAISAACNPPEDDENAKFKGLMWGEVAMGVTRENQKDSYYYTTCQSGD